MLSYENRAPSQKKGFADQKRPSWARNLTGKLTIAVIVLVALSMAALAWFYRYQQGRRSLELWGEDSALLIRHAPQVELLHLGKRELDVHVGSDDANGEVLHIEGESYFIDAKKDISTAAGLLHARHALIVDANFDWRAETGIGGQVTAPRWRVALQFSNQKSHATIVLDFVNRRVLLLEKKRHAVLVPAIAQAMHQYLASMGPLPENSGTANASHRAAMPDTLPDLRNSVKRDDSSSLAN